MTTKNKIMIMKEPIIMGMQITQRGTTAKAITTEVTTLTAMFPLFQQQQYHIVYKTSIPIIMFLLLFLVTMLIITSQQQQQQQQ